MKLKQIDKFDAKAKHDMQAIVDIFRALQFLFEIEL